MLEMKTTKMQTINDDNTYIHGNDEEICYKYKYENTDTRKLNKEENLE